MKLNQSSQRGFTLVELLVVIVIIASLAGLTAPMVINKLKEGYRTEAVSNARQIGIALTTFEQEYNSFPDDSTAETISKSNGDGTKVNGKSANDRFRQLFATGTTDSEAMFYAKTAYTNKPDTVISGDKALGPGECAFGIIMSGENGLTTSGSSARPIIATPFTTALNGELFDFDAYGGKAVVLKFDASVSSLTVNKLSKKAMLGGGMSLLQTGKDSVWGDLTDIKMVTPKGKGGSGSVSNTPTNTPATTKPMTDVVPELK
jgi:prepilin-type N-terminal cleavage/methylation domain-containing protein